MSTEIKEKARVESLLMSEELTKYLKPTIQSLSKDVHSVVKPITHDLRNELKESIRRVDTITNDLSKQLTGFNQLLKQLENNINSTSSKMNESVKDLKTSLNKLSPELKKKLDETAKSLEYNVLQNLVPQLKTEINEFVKSISHGLINDVRQATNGERAKLKTELQQLIERTENAIIKLQSEEYQSFPKKVIKMCIPIILTVFVTLTTLIGYQFIHNPISSLNEKQKKTYATGVLFERTWQSMDNEQRRKYRKLIESQN